MEPMTLGSPTHSPPGSPNTSFLPPFLMGEFNQPSTPRTGSLSPTKGRTLAFGASPPIRPTAQPAQPQYSTPVHAKPTSNVSFSNKANGPPTQGLFDSLSQPEWSNRSVPATPTPFTSPQQANLYHQDNVLSPNESYMQSQQAHISFHQSPNHGNESFHYNGHYEAGVNGQFSDDSNECWVTVFGFPPSAASMLLTQFSNCGNIVEKKFPSQGNWVWLKFMSRSEAGRALALNGRVFSGGLMIGVLPCSQAPNHLNPQVNNFRGGARHLAVGPSRLQNTSAVSPGSPANAGAQRSSGAISRALEYVFGW
ncbi:nucleoporin 35 [Arctopsyche grandis]|uniref:nucleoporin 35 n=1 Tax=Arctopsyche grandis TaxID=121162 RepID=UPI00406D9BAE